MRKSNLLVCLVVVLFSTTVGAFQDDWYKFTSPENRYSVLMPHKPTTEVVPNSSGQGTHNRFGDVEQGYAFVIEDLHDMGATDAEKYLDGVRDGVLKELKGTLLSETKITTSGFPGRELKLSAETDTKLPYISRTRIYVVGKSFYSMSFVYATSLDADYVDRIAQRYFSSIQFNPVP